MKAEGSTTWTRTGTDNMPGRGDNARMGTAEPRGRPGSEANDVELTYCVVSTSRRELLVRGLDALAR